MLRRTGLNSLVGIAAILAAGATLAAGLSGADAVKDRQTHFKEMGKAMKAIVEQLKSGAPDAAVIKVQTALIDDHAKALPTWFPASSGPATGVKMEALPIIWTDKADFAAKAHNLQLAAATLNATAQKGDMAALPGAMKATGEACKSCHEKFREKDKD
jgi:cytochrome c556